MAVQTNNQHRTNVAIHFPTAAQVLTITPTAADTTQYAGTIYIYDSNGTQVASSAYDYTSDASATDTEICDGIRTDIVGADVDDYSAITGTDTVIITCSVGYTAEMDNTGAGVLTAVSTGGGAQLAVPPVDAAAWVTAEGNTTAVRIMAEEFDPAFMLGQTAVDNVDMQTRVGEHQVPHLGLPTATGGTLKARIWGTGRSYSDGDRVAGTMLGRMLGHALGVRTRGNDTSVSTVNSTVSFDLGDVADLAVGQIIWFEDADDTARLWPAQITSLSGSTVGIDIAPNFTVATSDKVFGSENAYFEQAAITDPTDSNFSVANILRQAGPNCWVASYAHLSLDSITCERGQQPKLEFGVKAANSYPPGTTYSPSEPSWTGTVEGSADVQAIGRDTHVTIQAYATQTFIQRSITSAAVTPGVPVEMQEAVTEADDGAPGWAGYVCTPSPTTLTIQAFLTEADVTNFLARGYYKVRYYQVGPVGYTWCVHFPKAFLAKPPEPVFEGSNRWTLTFQATDDIDATTEHAKSKFVIART